ncbi:MAG TPA: helix-turn-helix domain-containing protein [Streptosporangiaceae bacterium]
MAELAGPRERGQRPPLLRSILGDVLRRTRLEQGRTLADVARAARVSMPYLSELERGLKEGSSEVVAAICDALRIDLADLLAQVGSDLDRARTDQVVRLARLDGAAPGGPGSSQRSSAHLGSGDAVCLLAA